MKYDLCWLYSNFLKPSEINRIRENLLKNNLSCAILTNSYFIHSIKIIIEAHDKAGIEKKTGETILGL